MLLEHVVKGDPVDVANFCMMLWIRSGRVVSMHPINCDQRDSAQVDLDAARYRWLRQKAPDHIASVAWRVPVASRHGAPDEAIDAAMAAEPLDGGRQDHAQIAVDRTRANLQPDLKEFE